jgi:hypothetical protein
LKSIRNLFFLLLPALIFSACSGQGSSGSVHGRSGSYYRNDEGGQAEVHFDRIKGTYYESFEISIKNDDWVNVNLDASVGKGRVRVFLKGPQDEVSEVLITPGQPGKLSGLAAVWSTETFHIYFEALDGEAEDIFYSLHYTY